MTIDQAMHLAVQHHQAGRLREAMELYRQVLSGQPDHPDALNNLGRAQIDLGRFDLAIESLRRAVAARPVYPQAYSNLGDAFQLSDQFDDALAAYGKAIEQRPTYASAHNNLGGALLKMGRLDEAMAAFQQAITHDPALADAHKNLGMAMIEQLRVNEAIACFREAIRLQPDFADAHYDLATSLLLSGDLASGWPEYEWRWRLPQIARTHQQLPQPRWTGQDLRGKTILLYDEQGFGDTLHFARYIPLVAQRGGRIILACRPELAPLLRQMPDIAQTIVPGDRLPPIDLHCPILSLPLVFETTLQSIPASVPYLHAEEARIVGWRDRLQDYQSQQKVGLAWAGRPTNTRDRRRSLAPAMLTPLTQVPGVHFISLQKGIARPEQDQHLPCLIDWTNELHDFADTAALIHNLDLIITVDTAVAHLAGAMGKPVWVLLPFIPDWRWMLDREDSPWYPTMKLFRQSKIGDWDVPIRRVVQSLHELANHHR